MHRKSIEPSLEAFSSLIGDIHDAGVDGGGWLPVLQGLNRLLNSQLSTVWMLDAAQEFRDVHSVQQDHARDYAAHYKRLDALLPAVMNAPTGAIVSNAMVVTPADFVRTEFYNDFAKRYDMYDCMVMRVFDSPGASGHVSLARSARIGPFQPSDMRLLALLLPICAGRCRRGSNWHPAASGRTPPWRHSIGSTGAC